MHQHSPEGPADCYGCKVKSLAVGLPKDFRSRTPSKTPPRRPNNSWEKGIARDERGMPIIRSSDLSPVGVKEAAQKRHLIDENKRRLRQDPKPLTSTR